MDTFHATIESINQSSSLSTNDWRNERLRERMSEAPLQVCTVASHHNGFTVFIILSALLDLPLYHFTILDPITVFPAHQSVNRRIDVSINKSTHQSTADWIKEWVNQWRNQWMREGAYGRKNASAPTGFTILCILAPLPAFPFYYFPILSRRYRLLAKNLSIHRYIDKSMRASIEESIHQYSNRSMTQSPTQAMYQ